jgi:DNA mismatch repair protein MutL
MAPHSQIRILPDHVANKIAAGEVVDRPASVVKELVENALDAGATQISVDVVAGGRKAIAVSDNGSGMSRDDALLSVERHATSKIRDADDIENVSTLGFRGEALAAISAVSQFTLVTRRADDGGGVEVVMSGGKMQDVRETGCPPGTTIHVRHLFYNIPARRKFLRSEETELTHVRQVFMVYALSYPEVGFALTVDGRETYRLASGAGVEDRLRDLYGADLSMSLRPVKFSAGGITVSGYAGLPHLNRADRTEQYIFINRRPAAAPLLSHSLAEAYHTLLPKGRYPVLFLYIEMEPSMVDVNVHPAKKEVRFRKPSEVRDAVIQAIRQALSSPQKYPVGTPPPVEIVSATQPLIAIPDLPMSHTFAYPRLPMVPSEAVEKTAAMVEPTEGRVAPESASRPWSWCRVLGQVGGLYVVMETEDGLVLMDPHAAHERLLFERYMREIAANRVASQGLLTPLTVELLPPDAQRVRDNLTLLKAMGFGVSEFGGDAFLVDALPTCIGDALASDLLAAVAQNLERAGARGGTERCAEENIAQAACKAAVKARDRLTLHEIEQLVVDLAGAEMPYTCPHGRPTVIFMSYNELHKKFGRM